MINRSGLMSRAGNLFWRPISIAYAGKEEWGVKVFALPVAAQVTKKKDSHRERISAGEIRACSASREASQAPSLLEFAKALRVDR